MENVKFNRTDKEWLQTSDGAPRGYIDPRRLRELWFHTGTVCNLHCPDCFEHSAPDDQRLESVKFEDVIPFIDEAAGLGIEKFSFTGGEPFVVKDTVRILDYALDFRPCLVLTNGTQPLQERLADIVPLIDKPNSVTFRISLDYPDAARHDVRRGEGMFETALQSLAQLHEKGFHVTVARRYDEGEDSAAVEKAYQKLFAEAGVPEYTPVIAFPNLEAEDTPEITEDCMSTHHTVESCEKFMCAFSRMVVRQKGEMRVYACTLVDDNPYYDLGSSLTETADKRVQLGHPRCFACFASGASCSEL